MPESKQIYADHKCLGNKKKLNILFTYVKTTYDYQKVNKTQHSVFLFIKSSFDPGANK